MVSQKVAFLRNKWPMVWHVKYFSSVCIPGGDDVPHHARAMQYAGGKRQPKHQIKITLITIHKIDASFQNMRLFFFSSFPLFLFSSFPLFLFSFRFPICQVSRFCDVKTRRWQTHHWLPGIVTAALIIAGVFIGHQCNHGIGFSAKSESDKGRSCG